MKRWGGNTSLGAWVGIIPAKQRLGRQDGRLVLLYRYTLFVKHLLSRFCVGSLLTTEGT